MMQRSPATFPAAAVVALILCEFVGRADRPGRSVVDAFSPTELDHFTRLRSFPPRAFTPSAPSSAPAHPRARRRRRSPLLARSATDFEADVATGARTDDAPHPPVSRISVCVGELCQCQGEDYGVSDAVINDLCGRGLSFPVDGVGCLGACGMGTTILIDYDNGDVSMTSGLDETLQELGLAPARGVATIRASAPPPSKKSKSPVLADARERMRDEVAASGERDEGMNNPWMTMASYLAKKATGSIFGE